MALQVVALSAAAVGWLALVASLPAQLRRWRRLGGGSVWGCSSGAVWRAVFGSCPDGRSDDARRIRLAYGVLGLAVGVVAVSILVVAVTLPT